MRSTRPQKLLAIAIIVLALLMLTPLQTLAVGVALFAVAAWLVVRFYPRRSS
jgi:membrane-bound ClpP family serine protease